jgi:hexosaminidase
MKYFFSALFSFHLCTAWLQVCPILPTPEVYRVTEGQLLLEKELSMNSDQFPERMRNWFIEQVQQQTGLRVVFSTGNNQMRFQKIKNGPENGYSITIQNDILIRYSSDQGCFYALNSLLQLMRNDQGMTILQHGFVQDQPKYAWRGLHLDVSRHFFTIEEIKRYLDLMSMYKFNVFHWHLTDDQGWRIEIKKYPKLTEVGAWRDSTLNHHYTTIPRTYTTEKYGGYYTQEQIREIVAYAKARYITVVPEIEMPGHSRAALAAYPEFSCSGDQFGVPGLWGVFDDIFCAHESSILFLQDILTEVLDLFPSEYIHIGGDEAPKTRWKKCKKCQAVIRENGLKDEHELQSFFIGKMDDFLTAHGRKLIGWDEILEGGLSTNAAVMSWRGMEGGIQAAEMGHEVVMSPGSHCYFDHYQSTSSEEPLAIGGFTSLKKVYEFDPMPPKLSPDQQSMILGAQANVWTEYIPDFKHVEYMVYPRAIALAQVLWSKNKPPFEEFIQVLTNTHFPLLDQKKVNYSKSYFAPSVKLIRKQKGVGIMMDGANEKDEYDLFSTSDEVKSTTFGGQILSAGDTLYYERTDGEKVVRYTEKITSQTQGVTTRFAHMVHPSLGWKIECVTPPNDRYSGNGTLTLVDGVTGKLPWKGHEWLGFDRKEIVITIDAEKKRMLDKIEFGFLEDHGSWIHYPENITCFVSKNNKKFRKVSTTSLSSITEAGKYLTFSIPFKAKGRYVKLIIDAKDNIEQGMPGEGNTPWTFMDELILFYSK